MLLHTCTSKSVFSGKMVVLQTERWHTHTHSPDSKQTDSSPSSRPTWCSGRQLAPSAGSSESHLSVLRLPPSCLIPLLLCVLQSHPWFWLLLWTSGSSSVSSPSKPLSFTFLLPLLSHFPLRSSVSVKSDASAAAPLSSSTFSISQSGSTDLRNRNTSQ